VQGSKSVPPAVPPALVPRPQLLPCPHRGLWLQERRPACGRRVVRADVLERFLQWEYFCV